MKKTKLKSSFLLKSRIRKLFYTNNLTHQQGLQLNRLNLIAANSVLSSSGQYFNNFKMMKCSPGRRGMCFGNAANKMAEGYGYVEGFIEDINGYRTYHAWNMDKDGVHVDFTNADFLDYRYYGIILDKKIVKDIGYQNGCTWISVLPFLKSSYFLQQLKVTNAII